MAAVQLALYKPHRPTDIGGRLVCWWTRSPYSHCELVVGGKCYSSSVRDGGVRETVIRLDSGHWDLVELPWVSAADVLLHFARTKGQPYGWLDVLLRQIFNKCGDAPGWFCSEWCAAAIGLHNPQAYSPAALGEYCDLAGGNRVWLPLAERTESK